MEFMQGPGTSPFPPTGIYYRLAHKCLVPRFFAYGSEWSVGQIKGRPFNVQAKGQLWPTRAFYAECAQVRAGRNSRNADFISIAQRAIRNPRPERPSNLRTLRPSGRSILRTLTPKVCPRAIPQPSARRAVKLKNPPAVRPVNPKNPHAAGVLSKEECPITTDIQWLVLSLAAALAASFFNYKNTLVNFSFARMRKKYIEDNDEQDPELIRKVAPFYQRTSQILGGTQVAFVIYCGIFAISLLGMAESGRQLLLALMGEDLSWAVNLILAAAVVLLVLLFWTGTILYPGTHALVEPLPILASHRWVVHWNRRLFHPLVQAGLFLVRRIFRHNKIPFRNEVNFTYTEDEIRCIVEESNRSGRLNALENTLIKNSFDFFDLMVRDVMIPRNNMVVLYYNDDMETMRRMISKAHHTCYPVCMDDKDQILGFIHVKDFMESLLHGQSNIKTIMREILTVPEVMPAPSLLQLMKNRRIYLAVVVDEYGGTSGLVTLEDLVEELIGEIPQSVDTMPYEILRMKDGTYEFDGTVILEDVSDRLEIDLAGEDKNATIGGFVFSHLERIPKVGDHVDFSGWRFSVLRMEGFRIVRVRAEKLAPSGKEESHDKED